MHIGQFSLLLDHMVVETFCACGAKLKVGDQVFLHAYQGDEGRTAGVVSWCVACVGPRLAELRAYAIRNDGRKDHGLRERFAKHLADTCGGTFDPGGRCDVMFVPFAELEATRADARLRRP